MRGPPASIEHYACLLVSAPHAFGKHRRNGLHRASAISASNPVGRADVCGCARTRRQKHLRIDKTGQTAVTSGR
jgi:hypothetical protein